MTVLTRAQAFTTITLARKRRASRTQSFLVGCVLGALVAWAAVGTPL